jgi:adenylate kinase
VPDEVIIGVVKDRLLQSDCQSKGWLLDGFPRTKAQAEALASFNVSPSAFVLLNVPDELLVERVVGRRTDPDTGKIYHLKYSPPPADVPLDRLVHRSDDTEEKIKVGGWVGRLRRHHRRALDATRVHAACIHPSTLPFLSSHNHPTQPTD